MIFMHQDILPIIMIDQYPVIIISNYDDDSNIILSCPVMHSILLELHLFER